MYNSLASLSDASREMHSSVSTDSPSALVDAQPGTPEAGEIHAEGIRHAHYRHSHRGRP